MEVHDCSGRLLVYGGLGRFYFQAGLPLPTVFDRCVERGLVPMLVIVVAELANNGVSPQQALLLVKNGLRDMVLPIPETWQPEIAYLRRLHATTRIPD